jgi:hypothetical protein
MLQEIAPNTVPILFKVFAALGKVDRRFAFGWRFLLGG